MIDYGCSGKRYQGCASRASAPGLDWAVENNSLHHVPMPVLQPILYPAFSRNFLDKHRNSRSPQRRYCGENAKIQL